MANSRLYKIAHPGHDGDYNGGIEVHSSLILFCTKNHRK